LGSSRAETRQRPIPAVEAGGLPLEDPPRSASLAAEESGDLAAESLRVAETFAGPEREDVRPVLRGG
jgi:hypothetical protein